MKKWCHLEDIPLMKREVCRDFEVLEPYTFHPVHWSWSTDFFKPRKASEKLNWLKDDEQNNKIILGAHIWNSLNGHMKAVKDSNQIYIQLIRSQCPLIYEMAPQFF